MNHSKNQSDSPLECGMHAKEEIKEILFNQRELKPNLHFNRVSSMIRSYPDVGYFREMMIKIR